MNELDASAVLAACERITGKPAVKWWEKQHARLMDDIYLGRMNPRKWFKLDDMGEFCRKYGLIDDGDLEISMIDYDMLYQWNPSMPSIAFSQNGNQVRRLVAFRINPRKHQELYSIYNTAR